MGASVSSALDPQQFTVVSRAKAALSEAHGALEVALDRDVLSVLGPIYGNIDFLIRTAIDLTDGRRARLAVVLHTSGGAIETTERIVGILRHFYRDVIFIIPDTALSAGTILAMSGDDIWMDFYSRLGPIDPQVLKNGKLVPALSYISQFERLIEKSRAGTLTSAEFALLKQFDLAELHQHEEAKALSWELLVTWLVRYKFKDWNETETRKEPVDEARRQSAAAGVAEKLSNHVRWHSHGRGISMETLRSEINIRIHDFGADAKTSEAIRGYFSLVQDLAQFSNLQQLVHSRGFL